MNEITIRRERVYLAGPMTGVVAFNYPKFRSWTKALREDGYEVISPVEISEAVADADELAKDEALLALVRQRELETIPKCDAIFLLRGWERSSGARAELECAMRHGLDILLEAK